MKYKGYLITDKIETQRTKYTLLFLSRGMHSTEARRKADAALLIAHVMAVNLAFRLIE